MIPPHYAIIPPKLFFRSDIPLHLRWTYIVLYALAWRHQYQYVTETMDDLANLFSEVEGQPIGERGIRERLQQLVKYGLIARERQGFRYRTLLLLQHSTAQSQPQSQSQPQPQQAAPARALPACAVFGTADRRAGGTGDAPGVTHLSLPAQAGVRQAEVTLPTSPNVTSISNRNTVDVVDLSGLDHQQQHLFYYLRKREVLHNTALDFTLKRIPLWEAVGWGEYAWARKGQLDNYAGLIVARLGAGDPAPEVTLDRCPMCGLANCCDECGFYVALDADEAAEDSEGDR